jgi:L-seryl-tRNA(Ser) seleniumtransferase
MGIYKELGIKRIINCFDTYTLLGGHIIWEEARTAREEADSNFAWIWDIQRKAGKRVAELLGSEAAFVPVGVYTGMSECVAALMAGTDPKKMRQLPDTAGMKNEVIVQKCLRDFQYDHSVEVTGAKLVEVGDEKKGCTAKQIEDAITSKTVAIHYMSHGTTGSYASKGCKWVPVEEVVKIGKRHKVPVLVDAAVQCYPLDGFRKYTAAGADAALYSSKYFGGPNTAGILVGKKYLVDMVALHSFIGQEGASHGKEFLSEAQRGLYGSLFRGCKQDRASIVAAIAALEKYLKVMEDPERNVLTPARKTAEYFMKQFKDVPDIEMRVMDANMEGVDPLKIALQVTLKRGTPDDAKRIRGELMEGDPEIWVEASKNSIVINITSFRGLMMFGEEDKKTIIDKVRKALNARK